MRRAVIVGVGGLGCPAAWALARAGLSLRLVDEDRVERSNLHRQMLFTEGDVGDHKVHAAARALAPFTTVDAVAEHVAPDNALRLLAGADVVVEGSDNLAVKFLVADACRVLGVPVVHGACVAWRATVLPVAWGRGACYRCVFEDLPDAALLDCATAGVYGPVTSVAGALMAADAWRLASGDVSTAGVLARYEAWRGWFRATRIEQREDCELCRAGARLPTLDAERYTLRCAAM